MAKRSKPTTLLGYMASGKGGPEKYFREKKLRRIAKGERAISFEKIAEKVFGGGFIGRQLSGLVGAAFDTKIPKEEREAAKAQLEQEFGYKFKSTRVKKERDREQRREQMLFRKINRIAKTVNSMNNDNQYNQIRTDVKFDNVMKKLQLLTEVPPETKSSVSRKEIENLNRKLIEIDFSQRRIEKLLLKGRGRKLARNVSRVNNISGVEPLSSEEIVSIVSDNTIEDIRKILIEKAPQREADIDAILTAIAKQQAMNQIEPDEMEEILKKALVKALRQAGLIGDDKGGILSTILSSLATVTAALTLLRGTVARIATRLGVAAAGAVGGIGAATLAAGTGAAAATGTIAYAMDKSMTTSANKALDDVVLKSWDPKNPAKLEQAIESSLGVAESRGKQYSDYHVQQWTKSEAIPVEARKYVAEYLAKRNAKKEQATATPAPAPPVNPATSQLADGSRENVASTTQLAVPGGATTVVQNFFNNSSTTAQIPEKKKIQPINNDNTFVRLLAQDVDHPFTYPNLNMG